MANSDSFGPDRRDEFDAGDRRHVRRREKHANTAERERREALGTLMGTHGGRSFMADLIFNTCALQKGTFDIAAPHTIEFREGQRSIGSMLNDKLIAEHRMTYLQMLAERTAPPEPDREEEDTADAS